jgi:Na+-driven multidrug efflux pump
MMTAEETENAATGPGPRRDSFGGAAVALGVLGFLPVPGVVASLLAIALGVTVRASASVTSHARQQANVAIVLGLVSVTLFGTFCFFYFVVLGYPLPHLAHNHPEH